MVDANGVAESVALATMHAAVSAVEYSEATQKASLILYSALLTLQQACLEESLTIPAGTVAVTAARERCEDLGLEVVASASTVELTQDASFNAGDSDLKVVNHLLGLANFWSVRPDGYGRLLMHLYQAPSQRQPVWTFEAGPSAVFEPAVGVQADTFNVPNKCVLTCSNSEGTFSGSYTNDDPESPYSTVCRGRTIALPESVTDAVDEADLDAKAERRLREATGIADTITVTHAYVPATIGDVVRVVWPKHGLDYRASIQSQQLNQGPECMTMSTLKRVWGS